MTAKELGQQPAFPFPSGPEPRVNEFHERAEGITLRQHIAVEMAKAFVARPTSIELQAIESFKAKCEAIAKGSMTMADALLERLAKEQP